MPEPEGFSSGEDVTTPGEGPILSLLNKFMNLDGVGPVDNRPSTYKLHQFVQKNKKK